MRRSTRILATGFVLTFALACAAPETRRPGGDPDQYRAGYAAPGRIEPAEFAYEDPDAAFRFPKSEGPVTFRQLEEQAVDGGLDWPDRGAAGMSEEEWEDPEGDRDFYGNEYGGHGSGGRGNRRPIVCPPVVKPPPPNPAPHASQPEATPPPEAPAGDRRKAKQAPVRPSRTSGAKKAPERPRR